MSSNVSASSRGEALHGAGVRAARARRARRVQQRLGRQRRRRAHAHAADRARGGAERRHDAHVPRRRGRAAHGKGERGQRWPADRVELAADIRSDGAAARVQQHHDQVHRAARESPTTLAFELTVEDSTGNLGRATTDVTVLPARDSDKFLSLDVARGASFDTFEVVAALAGGADHRHRFAPVYAVRASVSRLPVARRSLGRLQLRSRGVRGRRAAVHRERLPRRMAGGSDAGTATGRRHRVRGRVARRRHGTQRAGRDARDALVELALHAASAAPRRARAQPAFRRHA